MSNQQFVLRTEKDRKWLQWYVGALSLTPEGTQFKWGPFKPSKSDPQRDYFHGVVVRTMAREMGYGEAELKDVLVQMFTTPSTLVIDGLIYTVWKSTEKLNKDEYSQLIERSIQYAAEGGVFVPPAIQ